MRPLLDDFTVDQTTPGVTRLVGPVIDPCHLHGVLVHLPSVAVELISLGPLDRALAARALPASQPDDNLGASA